MRGKRNYDKRMRSSALQVGDRVLVRNLTPRGGPGKLRSFWEDKIHVVVARKGEGSPVYDVRPESSQGPSRTLHRNLLLPCDYLPGKPWEDPPPIKRTRPPTPYHCYEIQPLRHEDDSHESDSDDDLPAISYCNHSPENDQMQMQVQSTSEETVGEEPDFTHVHSGEVSSEMRTGANIADTPDEAQLNEEPQVVSGEVDNCEDTNNPGRPQRVRQPPKRLTYDSPGAPTYVRPINVNPSRGTQQCGMQTSPEPYIPKLPADQYSTLPPVLSYIPPPVPPMMSWNPNMMLPYMMPYPAGPQLPQWGAPYQLFQYT